MIIIMRARQRWRQEQEQRHMRVGAAGEARAALDQALNLVESLAAQLDAAELKAAFLNSPLVQELRSARSAVLADPPRNLPPQSTSTA